MMVYVDIVIIIDIKINGGLIMTKKEFMNLYGDKLIKGMKKDIESYFGKQLPFTVISTDLFDNKILVRLVKLKVDDVIYSVVTNYDKTDNAVMTNVMNDDCSISYKVYLNNSIFNENVVTEDKDTEGVFPEFDVWLDSKVKDEKNYNYFVKRFNEALPEYRDCIVENKKYNFDCLRDINTLIEAINEALYDEDYKTCNKILSAMLCDMKIFKDAKDGKIKLPKIKKGKKKRCKCCNILSDNLIDGFCSKCFKFWDQVGKDILFKK